MREGVERGWNERVSVYRPQSKCCGRMPCHVCSIALGPSWGHTLAVPCGLGVMGGWRHVG